MDDDPELSGVKVLRLFPLPGVVLFPHVVLPLHIFEPRYKQMTEDSLASDRLVTMVLVRPSAPKGIGPPALEEYGCVGRILQFERLADGKFNFLLLGLRRVRLVREVPSGKPYRTAEAEVIDEVVVEGAAMRARQRDLVALFRSFLGPRGGVPRELDEVISSGLTAGSLTDILAHALSLPASMKQHLLAERQVELRLDILTSWLRDAIRRAPEPPPPVHFPPPFSPN